MDGKTVKKARCAHGRALHLVAAVTHQSRRLVAQRPVDEKSNEITALAPMLDPIEPDGVVVTADAMQAQQEAARFLVQEKGADYFFSLKGNQPSVREAAERGAAKKCVFQSKRFSWDHYVTAPGDLSTGRRREYDGAAPREREDAMERPNLLYIFTDQQSAHMMSCTGNPHLRTPAMDRLAAQGTRFERAYCAQPLCGPSRTAMQTGVYPHQAGVPFNFREDECTCRPMPRLGGLLRDAGYDTGYIGKWHLCDWPRDTAVHGYDTVYLGETPRRDDSLPPFCDAFFRRRRDRPFAAVVSFVNPHDICQAARDQDFPNGNVGPLPPPEECPPLPANFAVAADEPELLQRVRARGGAYRWTQGWDEGRWRQYGWAYMRLTEKVDALVGRVLNSLAEAGHADDTVVVFSSDHGDGGGSHHWNQKQCLYEEAIRVPLIVMDPRGPRVARVDATRPVNNGLDLLPTLCDYAGTPPPAGRMGRSLRPLVEGREVESRDHTVVETVFGVHSHPSDDQGRALISRDWKYVVYNQGARREQLFRIREDPGEQDNRAADETCAATLGRHRELMRAWCRETDDQFPVPE